MHIFASRTKQASRISSIAAAISAVVMFLPMALQAEQIDISGPPGSTRFGASVTALPNGNFVVTDLGDRVTGVGVAYLYGANGALISALKGSHPNDQVGDQVVVLGNGNYLIVSRRWNDNAGAVTWGNATTGISGVVSPDNSLVGAAADFVGADILVLRNGNYVIISPQWSGGSSSSFGAVTWGDGNAGIHGYVSSDNSLVGGHGSDGIGNGGVVELANGNYVVDSLQWSNDGGALAGAVTWGSGQAGVKGLVSSANSLIGKPDDNVGSHGAIALADGNYVVASPDWMDSGVAKGAVTWGDGNKGSHGLVSSENSLVGSADDHIGSGGVVDLGNGNYVIASPEWNNVNIKNAGAVTWVDGRLGTHGIVSTANSLVGTTADEGVGKVTALRNGNYVVADRGWHNSTGAVVWANGSAGLTGTISANGALTGNVPGDLVGYSSETFDSNGVVALNNGNYVVSSSYFNNYSGAATWVDGRGPVSGKVSIANSLVGYAGDMVAGRVLPLRNGNYVAMSWHWSNATGAVTWGDGALGTRGRVSMANSLVGSGTYDQIGFTDVLPVGTSNYAIHSPYWDYGSISDAGAVTWNNGNEGASGTISAANSTIGSSAGDLFGSTIAAVGNGDYVVLAPNWSGASTPYSGAVFFFRGSGPSKGLTATADGVRGGIAYGYPAMTVSYDKRNDRLIVGRPAENLVTLYRPDGLFQDGFN